MMNFLREKLRESGRNRFVYWFSFLMISVFGLRDFEPMKNTELRPFRARTLRVYYRIAYDYWFYQRNIKEAYNYRIKYMLGIYHGLFSGNKSEAELYLSIISDSDFLGFLDINRDNAKILERLHSNVYKSFSSEERLEKEIDNILVCGPNSDLYSIDFFSYDFVVFGKPPPMDLKIDTGKIILILNNHWVLNKTESLEEWLNSSNPAFVFSPQPINYKGVSSRVFSVLPKFPVSASLMGLQRILFILTHTFNVKLITVDGFNFSLADRPYNDWYPSLINQQYGDINKGIYHSNKVHDFVLNIIFVRMLAQLSSTLIEGECVDIANNDISENISLFEGLYGK